MPKDRKARAPRGGPGPAASTATSSIVPQAVVAAPGVAGAPQTVNQPQVSAELVQAIVQDLTPQLRQLIEALQSLRRDAPESGVTANVSEHSATMSQEPSTSRATDHSSSKGDLEPQTPRRSSRKRKAPTRWAPSPWPVKRKISEELPTASRVICDPVHGHIVLSPLCARIVDTPQFQRLRFIKQLGFSYFVYPGASHNRFEHSLGTSHLAKELVTALRTRQPDLGIDDIDVLCVEIAGLCHDLGHGPFSHSFDKFIRKYRPKWKHEDQSIKMFEHLISENKEKLQLEKFKIEEEDIQFIRDLIKPPKQGSEVQGRTAEKRFLLEIICNELNGIDVDKWDYFARDCHMSGIKNSFDHMRCIRFARVIECLYPKGKTQQHICFRDKEAADLYEMYLTRSRLHRCLYQHKVSNMLDYMVKDALELATEHLTYFVDGEEKPLHKTIDNMKAYTMVNDDVFTKIQSLKPTEDRKATKAKHIIEDILHRNLYDMITEIQHDKAFSKKVLSEKRKLLLEKYSRASNKKEDLTEDDIILNPVTIDFGKKNKNPINHVWFYSKRDEKTAYHIKKKDVSSFLPEKFKDQRLRLFCKRNKDKEDIKLLKKKFKSVVLQKDPK